MIDFKEAFLQKFNDVLPSDEAALVGGMTLGGTAGMSNELKSQMSISGTSYLATMYGYKISILVFGSVGLLAGFIARRKRFVIALGLLLLFVVMAGGEATVIRAAIMGCIALIAREFGRAANFRNALTLTAAGMVFVDPTIVAQAAFQLSFLSLVGIVCLGSPLKHFLGWGSKYDERSHGDDFLGWREMVIMPISSLAPIVPIILVTFGQFSLMAFISNILVMPAILPVMLGGCAVAVTGFASHYLSFVIAKFLEIFIWYELGIIRLFSVIVVPLPQIFTSTWVLILYYAALLWFAYHYGNDKVENVRSSRGAAATKTLGEVIYPSKNNKSNNVESTRLPRRPGSMLPIREKAIVEPDSYEDDPLNNVDF